MAHGFTSTRHSSPGLKAAGNMNSAGTGNVTGSRLNKGGDKNWRGKRGGAAKMGSHKSYGRSMKKMDY